MDLFLSFIMVGRNDDYGINFLGRMQDCVDNLFSLSRKCGLPAELVLVEWNPPPDHPSLESAIEWSRASLPIRIVVVPPAVHASLPDADKFAVFEYIGKNVGIRRANGTFILVSNPDILFSEEMIERLAHGDLSQGYFYRANRHDGNVVHLQYGSFPPGNFPLGETGCSPSVDQGLHCNGSGDFTLLSQPDWYELRGYPEVPYNKHVDGHLIQLAHAAGLQQVILPQPIFHQHHDRSRQNSSGPPWSYTALPKNTNPNWGLADRDVMEKIIA